MRSRCRDKLRIAAATCVLFAFGAASAEPTITVDKINLLNPTVTITGAEAGMKLPFPDKPWQENQMYYQVKTDITAAGALNGMVLHNIQGLTSLFRAHPISFVKDVRTRLWNDYQELNSRIKAPQFIECQYQRGRRGGLAGFLFWYRISPTFKESDLTAPLRPHPFQRVGPARNVCPDTLDEAENLVKLRDKESIMSVYSQYFSKDPQHSYRFESGDQVQ